MANTGLSTKTPTGEERFTSFKSALRSLDLKVTCEDQSRNLEIWRVTGPKGSILIIAIIGRNGFDLFLESQTVVISEDMRAIAKLVGAGADDQSPALSGASDDAPAAPRASDKTETLA
ncbi:hypothetical protein HKCCE4037_06590 [Rhodobacterales bacterium HKCCE4037]|nr:hypothetical protein [Rhodobacterales bacterium HKCCE4037]